MDRLRKSLRESFRRKKDHIPECSKPHLWQADEAAVRAGTCSFPVKYLGCVEVFESRGMQVCEEALRVLRRWRDADGVESPMILPLRMSRILRGPGRENGATDPFSTTSVMEEMEFEKRSVWNSRRRMIKGTLYITGDGLRVVDDETKGLLVDQTIEKVSFCAPDRNHEKGFSYICRDGTTRRWMCHGFLSLKDSGERLSHAVGCAFAVCLERKQKRDKETVTVNYDPQNATFTRTGSFRQGSLTDRLQDPQDCKMTDPPPVKQVHNPFAIERPHAPTTMLQRQNSFKGFSSLNQASPFKRQLSLRISDLPSNVERQRSMSLGSSDMLMQQNGMSVTPIPESSPLIDRQDTISTMCQQLSQGLSFLSSSDDPFISNLVEQQQPNDGPSRAEEWLSNSSVVQSTPLNRTVSVPYPSSSVATPATHPSFPMATVTSNTPTLFAGLGTSLTATKAPTTQPIQQPVRRSSPNLSHLRSHSVGSADTFFSQLNQTVSGGDVAKSKDGDQKSTDDPTGPFSDPFNVEWAELGQRHRPCTNPFIENSVKTFEIQM